MGLEFGATTLTLKQLCNARFAGRLRVLFFKVQGLGLNV